MAKLIELAAMRTDTVGATSPLHLTTAAPRRKTFADAGAVDGGTYPYYILGADHAEHGEGVWDATAQTLTRVVTASTNGDAPIPLDGGEIVSITIGKKQLLWLDEAQTLSGGQKDNLAATLGLSTVARSGAYGDLANIPPALRGHIFGLTLANNATDPLGWLDIAAGEAASDHAATPRLMSGVAAAKSIGATWAPGAGGGLDAGTVAANTWYHVFQIMRSDTGAVDYLFSASATAPTMPANYDHKRRIGAIKTSASAQIVAFKQYDDMFYWTASVVDYANSPAMNTDVAIGLSVPPGLRVEPFIRFSAQGSTNSANLAIRTPDMMPSENTPSSEQASTAGSADVGLTANGSTATRPSGGNVRVLTNVSGQVVMRAYATSGSVSAVVRTYGWRDRRGRLS